MKETTDKRNRLLKDGGTVLLIVLLLLTFVSNEFMNHMIPSVSIDTVNGGTLTAAIRGSGTVMSAGTVNITSPAKRTVKTVEIKEGQKLSKGDLLFTFGNEPDGVLAEEIEKLDALLREYNDYAFQSPLLEDTTEISTELTKLKTDMDKAEYFGNMPEYSRLKSEYDYKYMIIQQKKQIINTGIEAVDSSLAAIADRIAEQQAVVRALMGEGSETSIFAPEDCTVTKVNCKNGDELERGDVLCVLETSNGARTLSFTVSKEQAECLKVGDVATIGSGYMESGITAKLRSMKTADTGKLLLFDIAGRAVTGEELTLYVGSQSSEFDLIVPNSALHTDSFGSYVLTVSSGGSSRHPTYTASRATVEVLAADDTRSAVTGRISQGDWIIVNTDSPIADGDIVLISE